MLKVFLQIFLVVGFIGLLSSCGKKSSSDETTTTTSYGDLPSQLATDVY